MKRRIPLPVSLATIAEAYRVKLLDFQSVNAAVNAALPRCVNHPDKQAIFTRGIERTPYCEECYNAEEDAR